MARVWEHLGEPGPPELARVNVTEVVGAPQVLDRNTMGSLELLTGYDRALLAALADRGLLPHRTDDQLDAEFEETAGRLGFTLA